MNVETRTRTTLRLLGTHWLTRSQNDLGWVDEWFDLDPAETAFVALHLWNVGDVNGPPIPDNILEFSGIRACIEESIRIADRYIAPSIEAARRAGLPIFHVEPAFIARKYESVNVMLDPDELNPSPKTVPPEANPGWVRTVAARCYGDEYWDWKGHAKMDVIASCKPEPSDQMILTGRQFDRILRSRGIKNLVYAGFNTNMCILSSAAATQEMLSYGYRIFLIREATLAVEYPETLEERTVTEIALKYFMFKVGDTIGFDQFVEACRELTDRAAPTSS